MKQFIAGITYFLAGFRLIVQPGVRLFVWVPLIINILLFGLLFVLMRHYVGVFDAWFSHFLPTWLQWLGALLWILFFLSYLLFFVFGFVLLANIVSAPFNSFLAEQVALHLTGTLPEQRTLWQNLIDIPRIIARQCRIMIYYIPRVLILFLLFFVPFVQLLAPVFWVGFHAWVLTLTYIDYPTDNDRLPIEDVQTFLVQHRFATLGFGLSVLLMSMVPFVNLMSIPVAVAGATKFWVTARRQAKPVNMEVSR